MLLPHVLRPLAIPVLLLVASCAPPAPAPSAPFQSATIEKPLAAKAGEKPLPSPPPPAGSPAISPKVVNTVVAGVPLTAVVFDSRTHRLTVADQAGGPGSLWPDARAAAESRGGLAAVNGGFFTPEGHPLGLVIAGGKRAGSLNRASSLGAGLFTDDGSPAIVRRERGAKGSEVLQGGPFLVDNGRSVPGLSPASSTARTILGWDGGSRWFIARTGACSLADLGAALAGKEIGGTSARTVLNLDGGRSSDLWVSSALQGGPSTQRPFWNKPVRNFLVLQRRH